jgi:hypothetical protein
VCVRGLFILKFVIVVSVAAVSASPPFAPSSLSPPTSLSFTVDAGMPKIPLAVVSTSSDDFDGSEEDLDTDFRGINWTVVNMASLESFPFSEVSHQPYGMDSTFLDSVSHGSAQLRTRNSTSGAQDMVSTSPGVSPQSPCPLLAQGAASHLHQQGSLSTTHPRGSGGGAASAAAAAAAVSSLPSSKVRNSMGSPAVLPVPLAPGLRSGKQPTAVDHLPANLGLPGAPPLSRRGRKAKPVSRRKRSLQIGAPRWRDSDGDMELLVRREVSKNGSVSPAATDDYAVLSLNSSCSSAVLTPPPLWVESPSRNNQDKSKSAPAETTAPVMVAAASVPTAEVAAAARAPLHGRRVLSPTGIGGTTLMANTQRQPPYLTTAENNNKKNKVASNAAPLKPLAAQTEAPPPPQQAHPAAPASSSTTSTKQLRVSAPKAAGQAALAATRRISPVKIKKHDAPTASAATAASPTPVGGSGAAGNVVSSKIDLAAHDDQGSSSSNPASRRSRPLRSVEFSSKGLSASREGRMPSNHSDSVVLPPVSSSSSPPSAAAAGVAASTQPNTRAVTFTGSGQPGTQSAYDAGGRPQSAKRDQRRCNGRPRCLSLPSSTTDTIGTTASSVESVVVKPNIRHPTLKPLIMSPDDSKLLRLPPAEGSGDRSPDRVRHSLPALSPQQLSSTSTDTPLLDQRRAQSVTPSVEVTPTWRSLHPAPTPDLSATAKPGSMNTLSRPLVDSPPTLRPQTREFTEKTDSGSATTTPSFVSPASRATAEKLVTFVRAVSDPEVLHVIYDYLMEQQRTTPRYRLAATACEELLARKEELLKTQEPEEGGEGGAHRSSALGHSAEAEPFTIDVKQPSRVTATEGGGAAGSSTISSSNSRAAELRRLLAEIAAEQEAKEQEEDPDADEFDDFNFFDTPYPTESHFSFGQPSVSGVVSRVFSEGMLFKIKTPKGEYYFYNDTLQDVMMVRVQFVLRGNEVINERAMLAPVEGTNETEITIAVLPEETNFFMSGVSHLPHFMAKRVPVPPDYVSPSVTQSLRKINGEINSVRKALGKWSRASDQDAFLKCCLKNHLKFTDLTFRPSAESLFRPDCDAVSIPPVTWRRPEEYVYLPEVSQTRLFRGEISCFLVKQGELNNHTVVAAMAAVAQFPDHVRWMFRHPVSAHVGKLERAEGCYRVTLLHNGWWKTYVLDDYVPASQKGPLFASCPEDPRRLWVPLLEKAYAKCLGSYAATCVVDAMEAMGDFTGFPVRYLDALWAAAKAKPTGPPTRTLFSYLMRVVRGGCTVLLFTPAASDAQSQNTVNLSRKRSSRLLPVKGVIPQFLPGHIYFLNDVAFYEELDLRMAQLKNPWTWETKNKMYREKKWKYTTWYDRPDVSVSAMGSAMGSSGALSSAAASRQQAAAAAAAAKVGMTQEERLINDRKGTMWVEWGELLAAFAGGGVCYTLWNHHRYRTKNAFVNGRPRFVLEMKARRKVELFVTLSLETVCETLDNYGTVVASRPTPLYGTALSVVQRVSTHSGRVVSESCEDVECVAARRTYVVAKDVSMKVTIDPRVAEGSVLVVPLLDPQAVEDMAAAAAAKSGGGSSTSANPTASDSGLNESEVHFVLSVVSDAVAGDGEDLSISFVSMRRSCGVFTGSSAAFGLEGTTRVASPYQICTEKGVTTLEGNRICDTESVQPPPS